MIPIARSSFFATDEGKAVRVFIFGGLAAALLAAATFVAGVLTTANYVFKPEVFLPALGTVVVNALLVYLKNLRD